ncbi:MAG: energy-coupling factor transporter transmembrane component T family protein, partial [Candidatus Limnocylindria bacterium]
MTPIVPDPGSGLGRANPVAKLGAALVLLLALFASLDGVTAAVVLAGLVALLPASGLSVRALLARAWLVGIAAISIAVLNVLFAADQLGPTVLELGPLRIGAETLVSGVGLALRLLAIALAGLLATATSDPIDVADALIQQLRVSPRFAIGVLAALRLLPMLAQEWQILGMARRARGVAAG